MSRFESGQLDINYGSSKYGPFIFDFADAALPELYIESVVVRSFLGRVTTDDDLSQKVETTSSLIESSMTVVNGRYQVGVFFKYPGPALEGNHSLIFEVTWNSGGKHAYSFYKVRVG